MSHDLFGDPVPHLSKNANGYLLDLAELQASADKGTTGVWLFELAFDEVAK